MLTVNEELKELFLFLAREIRVDTDTSYLSDTRKVYEYASPNYPKALKKFKQGPTREGLRILVAQLLKMRQESLPPLPDTLVGTATGLELLEWLKDLQYLRYSQSDFPRHQLEWLRNNSVTVSQKFFWLMYVLCKKQQLQGDVVDKEEPSLDFLLGVLVTAPNRDEASVLLFFLSALAASRPKLYRQDPPLGRGALLEECAAWVTDDLANFKGGDSDSINVTFNEFCRLLSLLEEEFFS